MMMMMMMMMNNLTVICYAFASVCGSRKQFIESVNLLLRNC